MKVNCLLKFNVVIVVWADFWTFTHKLHLFGQFDVFPFAQLSLSANVLQMNHGKTNPAKKNSIEIIVFWNYTEMVSFLCFAVIFVRLTVGFSAHSNKHDKRQIIYLDGNSQRWLISAAFFVRFMPQFSVIKHAWYDTINITRTNIY